MSSLQEEVQLCPTNSSFPVTEVTEPVVLSAHFSSLLLPNSVSMPSLHQSGPVFTSGTSVASKFAPETSQSVSALLAYVPQCSVSVSQGAQGAVHVSAAVLPSPQPPVVPASVVYCTSHSSSVQATSASSPQAVAANLVSKLIS